MAVSRPKFDKLNSSAIWLVMLSSLFGLMTMLGRFYAFQEVGIIYTTLIAILGPILVFLASWEILHEKIKPRVIISALIILACVVVATVLSFG